MHHRAWGRVCLVMGVPVHSCVWYVTPTGYHLIRPGMRERTWVLEGAVPWEMYQVTVIFEVTVT
jgi:hypothetical protein